MGDPLSADPELRHGARGSPAPEPIGRTFPEAER